MTGPLLENFSNPENVIAIVFVFGLVFGVFVSSFIDITLYYSRILKEIARKFKHENDLAESKVIEK